MRKILIVGDSGRGKSTLAKKLSQKSKIKYYSTDDFLWKKKFTVLEDKSISYQKVTKIYNKKSWIVEGSTRSLIKDGLAKSDLIVNLKYHNLLSQFWYLFKRHQTRKNETLLNLIRLYIHLFCKKYHLGSSQGKLSIDDMLKPYQSKTIVLSSFEEISKFVKQF